jgi:hypothetical protein
MIEISMVFIVAEEKKETLVFPIISTLCFDPSFARIGKYAFYCSDSAWHD